MIHRIGKALLISLFVVIAVTAAQCSGVGVIGGLTRQMTVQPGSKVEGKIVLKNTSDESSQVKIYQTDYLFTADGRNSYGDPGKQPRSNATWISFTPKQVEVPAHDVATVYYTVQAPADTKLTGTYWSVLMVEPLPAGSLGMMKQKDTGIQIGIRTISRYAVQMVTNIGDTGTCDLKFADTRILAAPTKRVLQVDMENVGQRWLTPTIWAEVFDEGGKSLGRLEGNRLRLYPGCSGRFLIDISGIPKGNLGALVVADNGDEHVFGSQYKFEIK